MRLCALPPPVLAGCPGAWWLFDGAGRGEAWGACTALGDRDEWAEIKGQIREADPMNAESLRTIDTALCLPTLERDAMLGRRGGELVLQIDGVAIAHVCELAAQLRHLRARLLQLVLHRSLALLRLLLPGLSERQTLRQLLVCLQPLDLDAPQLRLQLDQARPRPVGARPLAVTR